jgi:hypothetical protein
MLLLIYIPLLFCFFLLAMLSSVISSVSQFITRWYVYIKQLSTEGVDIF